MLCNQRFGFFSLNVTLRFAQSLTTRSADRQSFDHRSLFYAPQNREDSRSSDFESRLVFSSSFLILFRKKRRTRRSPASRSMDAIQRMGNQFQTLIDGAQELPRTLSNFRSPLNRKLDSFEKVSSTQAVDSSPTHLRLDQLRLKCLCELLRLFLGRKNSGLGFSSNFIFFFVSLSTPEGKRSNQESKCLKGSFVDESFRRRRKLSPRAERS